jgi:hypothetical protein
MPTDSLIIAVLFQPAAPATAMGAAHVTGASRGAMSPLARLKRMQSESLRAAEGDRTATLDLCRVLENRAEPLTFRLSAALFLAGAGGLPEAIACLRRTALAHAEPPQLRAMAMLSLANIGGPLARAALESVLLSREAEKPSVIVPEYGKPMSLQRIAGDLLLDFDQLNGRETLHRIALHPGEYWVPTFVALAVVFHKDPSEYLQGLLAILWNHSYPEALRLEILRAYVYFLGDSDFEIFNRNGWWDSLASIAAATKTESHAIREAAAKAIKQYRSGPR